MSRTTDNKKEEERSHVILSKSGRDWLLIPIAKPYACLNRLLLSAACSSGPSGHVPSGKIPSCKVLPGQVLSGNGRREPSSKYIFIHVKLSNMPIPGLGPHSVVGDNATTRRKGTTQWNHRAFI